ncbi:hypothetical protein BLAC_07050 [Bifidobacterium animalis subsp. lactis ATCC 27673]|uniref:hypothetical protein n=1 Tax=Bifidobacterium animalis TaxID=28025 RepID=UPI0003B05508|nr:hypothetical protein [Bifidobacterium animalis]AGW85581.1 hypothetical protein BLAC_07050 [Bifidobacterium animalis subsp. lactis ATCC 27673]KOA44369.1 hypothetical protein BAAA27673_07685 [Bifidobacterium animalis subsp. lactis ATCC 27673]UBZ01281.1 hypothetical protein LDH92_07100 [Bifidobacterium animalis subsp. lactis]
MSTIDLYHRTSIEAVQAILASGRLESLENTNEAYASTHIDGQAEGYGEAVVHVRVDDSRIHLDDEFPDGERHYRIPLDVEIAEAFTITPQGERTALSAPDTTYRLSHRAPEYDDEDTTARLDQVLHSEVYPSDVLEHPDWYGARYPESIRQVRAAATAGDPNRPVTIYRAVPIGVTRINTGDWVALSRSYANDESQRVADDGSAAGNIISARVPASSLYSEGILEEWGYQGPPIETRDQREHTKTKLRDRINRDVQEHSAVPPSITSITTHERRR